MSAAGLQRLIDAWMPYPAHIMDPYWNTVAHNDAAHLVLGHGRPGVSPNCLIAFFTDRLPCAGGELGGERPHDRGAVPCRMVGAAR